MIDFLARLLGYVMQGCLWLVNNNYVLALLIFAVAMQILMSPLGIKQQKNMVKQAYLRPKEMAIRRKYAGRNDRTTMQKMQNEIMQLQQEAGYSPLSGCLPMIVQMILIFPIYNVAIRPLEYVSKLTGEACVYLYKLAGIENGSSAQIKLISWLNQPGNIDKIPENHTVTIAGTETVVNVKDAVMGIGESMPNVPSNLGVDPIDGFGESFWWIVLIPIINLGLMYLSQFITKKLQYQNTLQQQQAGQMGSMKIMMLVLPLVTMFVTFNFAAAIGIYWIFRTLLSMLQQFILYKAMPYPKFTEEDYRRAEKEMKGKYVPKGAPANYVPSDTPVRSLHHIDDDE